ncbi:hypothetical protein [Candidatus Nitrotoga sp. 1052]|uniref:hypothetical protein n=1 Tax=Candidatus Nitrotoga sp. 1052 TaxID=2886964 RepID=UPI001EF66D03|nr:hypothetical protein [Candidatus Nitrotoga sp. 1052]
MNKYVVAIIIFFSISGAAHGCGLAPKMAQGIVQGLDSSQQQQQYQRQQYQLQQQQQYQQGMLLLLILQQQQH